MSSIYLNGHKPRCEKYGCQYWRFLMTKHQLAVICACGCAFWKRLNPLLPNDAFMLPVSPCPSLCLSPSFSHLIKRMGQYASDIKRHQSPHTVYFQCHHYFILSPSFSGFFFGTHIDCLQTLFDVEHRQTTHVCVSTHRSDRQLVWLLSWQSLDSASWEYKTEGNIFLASSPHALSQI